MTCDLNAECLSKREKLKSTSYILTQLIIHIKNIMHLYGVAIFGLGAKLMTFSLKAKASKSPLRGAGDLHEKRETAQYISEMTLVLRNLAKTHEMLSLQGLLEVAHYEAFIVATQNELPENELEHLKELSRASIG